MVQNGTTAILSTPGAGGDQCAEGLGGHRPHHPPAGGDSRRLPEAEAEGPAGRGGCLCWQYRGLPCLCLHVCAPVQECSRVCVRARVPTQFPAQLIPA